MPIFGAGAGIKPASVAGIGPYCTQMNGKLGIITPTVLTLETVRATFPCCSVQACVLCMRVLLSKIALV